MLPVFSRSLTHCCVAVVCKEEDIPPFRADSAPGTTDMEERKAEDPENWNTFRRRLLYTCPVGFVIERPGGEHDEQQEPIPEEPDSFEVECEADAIWTPKPLHGGTIMPQCIRKYKINICASISRISYDPFMSLCYLITQSFFHTSYMPQPFSLPTALTT